jgi:hypothetical protein
MARFLLFGVSSETGSRAPKPTGVKGRPQPVYAIRERKVAPPWLPSGTNTLVALRLPHFSRAFRKRVHRTDVCHHPSPDAGARLGVRVCAYCIA